MIIKYCSADNRLVEIDLDKLNIRYWGINNQLGWKCGNLDIKFDESGMYPPVDSILNYDETIRYLKNKHGDKEFDYINGKLK